MIQVNSPSQFPEDAHIGYFTGKDYYDAIQAAKKEAERIGVVLISWYEQKAFGKSILVSYKKKEVENENISI